MRKLNAEKKEVAVPAASISIRGYQSDSPASRTGTSGETKNIDKAPSTMSISRTATSGSSLTALLSKKLEDTPAPSARTRKRSGKESKDVSSGSWTDAVVRPVEECELIDKKNVKVNEGEVKSDRNDIKSGVDKNQVWSKDSKHMKQLDKEVPNQRQEHSESNLENPKGVESNKRDAKEEVDVQKSNRNKFISNPLRRSLKSRKSIKRQGSVKRGQQKPSTEERAVVPEKKVDDPKKAQEQVDPLNFIEIRSAAQWKAISQRISWKFDDCAEEASAEEKEPSGKTRVLPKNRVGAVTLKAPQFDDLPNE